MKNTLSKASTLVAGAALGAASLLTLQNLPESAISSAAAAGGVVTGPNAEAPDRYVYYPGTETLAADEVEILATPRPGTAVAHDEGIVVSLHPGTTDTPLSKPFQRNVPEGKLFEPSFVADRLLAVVDGLTSDDSGGFFAWDGSPIPW